MKFKDYLTEMLHLDFIEKTDLEKAKDVLIDKCKGQNFEMPLWRGMRDTGETALLHGKKVDRVSKDGNNLHTLMFAQTFKKNMLPLRHKAIITYSNKGKPYAKGYGKLYAIFPYNDANIGICKTNDILNDMNTKYNKTIEELNYGISDLFKFDGKFKELSEVKEAIKNAKEKGFGNNDLDDIFTDELLNSDVDTIYDVIVDLYDPKYFQFKRTVIKNYKDTTPTGQELWFSDTCVAIRVDVWEKLVEEGFKL